MIDELVHGFDSAVFCELLNEKFAGTFALVTKPIPVDNDLPWKSAEQLGVVKTLPGPNDVNMPLVVVAAELPEGEELRERSSRVKQFKFAKKVLDTAMSNPSPGVDGLLSQGLFVFHDDQGNFRLSLVHGKPEGTKLVWSAVRRMSFYVEAGDGNKTFRDRVALPWSTFDKLKDAFSVEKLTKEFYSRLFEWYQWALSDEMGVTYPNDTGTHEDDRQISEHIIRLITRLMFVWFLKQKHLVPDQLFDPRELSHILKNFDPVSGDNYYRAILQNLFFATLNSEIPERGFATQTGDRTEHFDIKTLYRYPKEFALSEAEVLELFRGIPFLNGGLFECLDRGRNYYDGFSRNRNRAAQVPNRLFFDQDDGLIPLLRQYNFTVEENAPRDEEVALDPELLGKVFENLLAAYNPETNVQARKATGSFYTPREIVNYMVDESLIAHLKARCGDEHEEPIRKLFAEGTPPTDAKLRKALDEGLVTARILDPACGSGAFPMGMLLRMVDVLRVLRGIPEDDPVYELKLQLIENCIYGADIQCIAVQISKLRFFISLVCEQKPTDDANDNYGIHSLPNLETKFVAANSLIGLPQSGRDVLDLCTGDIASLKQDLFEIRHRHFSARTYQEKKQLRREDKKFRDSIKRTVRHDAQPDRKRLEMLLKEREKVAEPKWVSARPAAQSKEMFSEFASAPPSKADTRVDANEKKRKALDADIAREHKKESIPSTQIDSIADMLASWDPYDQNTSAEFLDAEWMFNIAAGFDVVLGNPPYVSKQALLKRDDGLVDYAKSHFDVAQGRDFDLFAFFIEVAVGLGAPHASVCLIVPTGWYTGPGFSALRRFVATRTDPRRFVNLPYDMFENAWIDTTVFLATKRTVPLCWPRAESCPVALKTFAKRQRIQSQEDFYQDTDAVDAAKWFEEGQDEFLTRSSAAVLALLAKIRRQSKPLSEVADIQRGVTPFKLTEKKAHQNSRRAFAGTVRRYKLDPGPKRYIRFDSSLAELKPARYFKGRRVLLREMISRQMRLQGCIATDSFVTNKSMQSILPTGEVSPEVILAVLNSQMVSWFFLQKSNVGHRDDFPKIVLKETRALPFPSHVPEKDAGVLASCVESILAATPADADALDAEVDRIVYGLFALTPQEIATVEEGTAAAAQTPKRPTKARALPPKTKVSRRRKPDLPPSLPGWE